MTYKALCKIMLYKALKFPLICVLKWPEVVSQ